MCTFIYLFVVLNDQSCNTMRKSPQFSQKCTKFPNLTKSNQKFRCLQRQTMSHKLRSIKTNFNFTFFA